MVLYEEVFVRVVWDICMYESCKEVVRCVVGVTEGLRWKWDCIKNQH